MDLDQLIEMLTDLREATSGDRPVYLAIQPNYPIALTLRGVADGAEAVDDPSDEAEVSEAVWIVANDSHPRDIVYPPAALWEIG